MSFKFFHSMRKSADEERGQYLGLLGISLPGKEYNPLAIGFFAPFESLHEFHNFVNLPFVLPILGLSLFLVNLVYVAANILLMAISFLCVKPSVFEGGLSSGMYALGHAITQPLYLGFDAFCCLLALVSRSIATIFSLGDYVMKRCFPSDLHSMGLNADL